MINIYLHCKNLESLMVLEKTSRPALVLSYSIILNAGIVCLFMALCFPKELMIFSSTRQLTLLFAFPYIIVSKVHTRQKWTYTTRIAESINAEREREKHACWLLTKNAKANKLSASMTHSTKRIYI
jgi:hypothetical protein